MRKALLCCTKCMKNYFTAFNSAKIAWLARIEHTKNRRGRVAIRTDPLWDKEVESGTPPRHPSEPQNTWLHIRTSSRGSGQQIRSTESSNVVEFFKFDQNSMGNE